MHGRGKSDEAIVALKRVNHEAQALREPVERRAEAKGNAGQTSTRQTQSRESVTQGLERIREVAKAKEKERFTALFHHLSLEHLEMAFFELEGKAAAGVDGLTWHSYAAGLEGNLDDLHGRLHRGAYPPLPSRRLDLSPPDATHPPPRSTP